MAARLTSLARVAVDALQDMKGVDIRVLDVKKITTVTDYMIMCTGTSSRHVKSLAENVLAGAKQAGERPRGAQGMEMGEWVLVDLGSVVVHVMQTQTRAFYQLEKLWDVVPEGDEAPAPKPKKAKKAKPRAASPRARKTAKPASRAKTATGGGPKKKRR